MAPRLRRLSARDVLRILKSCGFEVVSTRDSHAKLRRITDDGRRETLTLPLHKELDVTMAFCGHTQLTNVDRSILVPGTY